MSIRNELLEEILAATGGGGASTFDALSDTPPSKVGNANMLLQVNAGETAIEYVNAAPPAVDTMQDIYTNSAPAKTTTNGVNGAVQFQGGETDDELPLVEIKSNAGDSELIFYPNGTYSIPLGFTTGQRDALTPAIRTVIYNNTRSQFEVWDGDVWVSRNVIKKHNNTGVAVVAGDVVVQSTSVDNSVTLTSTVSNVNWPAVVVDGGVFGDFITVAVGGVYPVSIAAQPYNRGDRLITTSTNKQAQLSAGTSVGVFGVAVEAGSGIAGQLVLCQIGVNAELI